MSARRQRARQRDCAPTPPLSGAEVLRRRARRLAGKGEWRKAALALRELAQSTEDPCAWAALGSMLVRAQRVEEACRAFHRAMWLHGRLGARGRARTLARMIVGLDPGDRAAERLAMAPLRAA